MFLDCDWSISVQFISNRSAKICNKCSRICNKELGISVYFTIMHGEYHHIIIKKIWEKRRRAIAIPGNSGLFLHKARYCLALSGYSRQFMTTHLIWFIRTALPWRISKSLPIMCFTESTKKYQLREWNAESREWDPESRK